MKTEIGFKYVSLSLNEEFEKDKPFYWASVDFSWKDADSSRAKAFGLLMDSRTLTEVRALLENSVTDVIRDIYLEDVSLLINIRTECKHDLAKLLGLIPKLEAEFDALVEAGAA